MKIICAGCIALSIALFASCGGTKSQKPRAITEKLDSTEIGFDEPMHDFGKVTEGEKLTHTFTFTNTGASPLVVNDCKASCGCTVPEWTADPVQPGEKGEITIVFNTTGKHDKVTKRVDVFSNAKNSPNFLRFSAEIAKKND